VLPTITIGESFSNSHWKNKLIHHTCSTHQNLHIQQNNDANFVFVLTSTKQVLINFKKEAVTGCLITRNCKVLTKVQRTQNMLMPK